MNPRIIFFGTPDFAVASLKALVDAGMNVIGVVTAPDKPAGRGQKLHMSPVKTFALELGIQVLQPTNLKSDAFMEELHTLKPDLQIVVAFRMLPEKVWSFPVLGTYNLHASLLPDYRGAAPINWAIINGETETGVTTFKLQHAIDTGSILLQERVAIEPSDNAGSLHDKLMTTGASLLVRSVELIAEGKAVLQPQDEAKALRHAPKLQKEHGLIDPSKTAREVHDLIRGMTPFPGAFLRVALPDGTTDQWKVLESSLTAQHAKDGFVSAEAGRLYLHCADDQLEIVRLQPAGKRAMPSQDFLNGLRYDLAQVQKGA